MPRNKTSNDLDHVKKDPKPSRTPKGRPPKPWPLPKYKPVKIKQPWTNGHSQLPSTITPDDPYAIFNLFFTDQTIETLVRHTNEYIRIRHAFLACVQGELYPLYGLEKH